MVELNFFYFLPIENERTQFYFDGFSMSRLVELGTMTRD